MQVEYAAAFLDAPQGQFRGARRRDEWLKEVPKGANQQPSREENGGDTNG
jgi:hypothetical protein